jgi:hypothetical protein
MRLGEYKESRTSVQPSSAAVACYPIIVWITDNGQYDGAGNVYHTLVECNYCLLLLSVLKTNMTGLLRV